MRRKGGIDALDMTKEDSACKGFCWNSQEAAAFWPTED